MSNTQRETVKAGIFVLISGVTFVLFLVILLGRSWFRSERTYYTVFDSSVQGLETGSAVKYLGVPAGTVGDIRFEPGSFPNIRVTMKLKDFVPVKETTRAVLVMTNLTGVAQIELVGGNVKDQEIGDGAYIQSQSSAFQRIAESLPKFAEKLPTVLDRVEQAAQNLGNFFGQENQAKLSQSLSHLENTLSQIQQKLDATSKEFQTQFAATADEARKLLQSTRGEMEKTLQEIRSLTTGENVKAILADMRNFSQNLANTGEQVGLIAADLHAGIQTNQKALSELLRQLKDVGRHAQELMSRLRQNPSAILFASPVPEREIPDPDSKNSRKP